MRQRCNLFVILVLVLAALPAKAVTSVSACNTTLSTPGVYQLTTDLNCGAATGVTIASSNVSLQLNGKRITGTAARGIYINPSTPARIHHVSVQGPGLISGFFVGISSYTTDYSQISQVMVRGGTGGINDTSSTYLSVASNIVGRTLNQGIQFFACISCVVAGNSVSGAGTFGILLDDGNSNTVSNNVASGNAGASIFVRNELLARVTGNTTNGNGVGIAVQGGTAQIFSNTAAFTNEVADLFDVSPTCAGNLWANNNFFNANQTCIH